MGEQIDFLHRFSARQLSWAAFVSATVLTGVVWKTPQSLYSDPAYQMDALQEYFNRSSHCFNCAITPDEKDLSKNQSSWIIWWPPGPQLFIYPLVAKGVSIGFAVRCATILCIVIGAIGWARWMSLFELPGYILLLLAISFPWMRYASNPLFLFSTETCMFATGPWVLLLAASIAERWEDENANTPAEAMWGFVLGLSLAIRFILKYSSAFTSVGICIFLVWAFRHRLKRMVFRWSALGAGFIVPVAFLSIINSRWGGAANGVTRTAGLHLKMSHIVSAIADPVLALADSESLLRYVFVNPVHPRFTTDLAIRWLVFPFGLLLYALLIKSRPQNILERLTKFVFFSTVFCLTAVWMISKSADHNSRHLETAALAILPFTLVLIRRQLAEQPGAWRATLWRCFIALFIGLPLLYGFISVFAKVIRTPPHYALDAVQIYNPLLADQDLAGVIQRLDKEYDPATDVWYLPEPISALNIPGRTIVRPADFMELTDLERDIFRTSQTIRLRVLLPPKFETNGKGPLIRSSFIHAGPWTSKSIPGCNYLLWESRMDPDSAS